MQLFNFTCSHCGAPLEYSTEIVECRYCGSHFIFDGLQEYTVEEKPIERQETHNGKSDYFYYSDDPYWYNPRKSYPNPCPSLWGDGPSISEEQYHSINKFRYDELYEELYEKPKRQNKLTKFIKRLCGK